MKASTQKQNKKTTKAAFGRKVMKAFAQLAKDKETSSRFCRTTTAARYWMCFSKWLAEHPGKLADETALDFMHSLANAMTSCELAYVLQFETQPSIVRFLADEIEQAIRRESVPERLQMRRRILRDGLHKPFYQGVSVAKLAEQTGSHFINVSTPQCVSAPPICAAKDCNRIAGFSRPGASHTANP